MKILTLNGGSSSIKSSLYEIEGAPPVTAPQPLWQAQAAWNGGEATLSAKARDGGATERRFAVASPLETIAPLLRALWEGDAAVLGGPGEIASAGHRIVHGGASLIAPALLDDRVKRAIAAVADFAPEHAWIQLGIIDAAETVLGAAVPQIAVFDTAFHASLAPAAYVYPGPYAWLEQGIRRYGFHGISYQYVTERAAAILGARLETLRLVVCHLGNGCSLAAVRDGHGVDTTMGFTPLEGLMMGTRSGSVDPAVVIHLIRKCGATAEEVDRTLNRESGLRGVSGVSSDFREVLQAAEAGNARARLALDVFVHRLRREIGGMIASLGGLDALVFTGGIGENRPEVRAAACEAFGFLGLRLDEVRNRGPVEDEDVAAPDSAVRVLVVHTKEDWQIARECHRLAGPRD